MFHHFGMEVVPCRYYKSRLHSTNDTLGHMDIHSKEFDLIQLEHHKHFFAYIPLLYELGHFLAEILSYKSKPKISIVTRLVGLKWNGVIGIGVKYEDNCYFKNDPINFMVLLDQLCESQLRYFSPFGAIEQILLIKDCFEIVIVVK